MAEQGVRLEKESAGVEATGKEPEDGLSGGAVAGAEAQGKGRRAACLEE